MKLDDHTSMGSSSMEKGLDLLIKGLKFEPDDILVVCVKEKPLLCD